jgi:hypothetical protein
MIKRFKRIVLTLLGITVLGVMFYDFYSVSGKIFLSIALVGITIIAIGIITVIIKWLLD